MLSHCFFLKKIDLVLRKTYMHFRRLKILIKYLFGVFNYVNFIFDDFIKPHRVKLSDQSCQHLKVNIY